MRSADGHLGVLEHMDGETEFAIRAKYRLTARKGYVKQDCSARARRAMLRRAAPIPGPYQSGDLVCFRREQRRPDGAEGRATQRNMEPSQAWSTPARIIGFEGKTVWVICEGVPVATATDKLRPCTAQEVLAHQVLSRGFEYRDVNQQGFVDQRHARAEEPDSVHDDLSEHSQDDEADPGFAPYRGSISQPIPEEVMVDAGELDDDQQLSIIAQPPTAMDQSSRSAIGDLLAPPSPVSYTHLTLPTKRIV